MDRRSVTGGNSTVPSHFLLDMLQNRKCEHGIDHWNARIRQFRDLLTNPDEAPIKATIDLNANRPDAEEKLINFHAEMVAVAHLSSIGYRNFSIVLPATNAPSPDFMADFNGQVAAIEVKNLQPPADRIQTVVSAHWKKIGEKSPDRYGLNVILRHNHFGELKAAAQQRLRTILDQLPDIRHYPFQETLEGGVKIRIDILENAGLGNAESFLRENLMSGPKGQLIVNWGIGLNFADETNSEEKALFLKRVSIDTTRFRPVETGPQATLFPEARPGVVIFVCFPDVEEREFVSLLENARPSFVIDLRIVPRFDVGRLNRDRAFDLSDAMRTRYIDLTGVLMNGPSREDVMRSCCH
jgi:hypothetical protein